jgi:hypothetical protein
MEILKDLEFEGCPFCGLTSLDMKGKSSPTASKNCYAVMFCKRFGCRHVAHNLCINEVSVRKLLPLHNTNWFIVRQHQHKFKDMDVQWSKNAYQLNIRVCHIVSNICYADFATAKPIQTRLKPHSYGTAIETLELMADEAKYGGPLLSFPVCRAQMQVSIVNSKSSDPETVFEANFELSGAQTNKWNLLASSSNSQKFLSVHVEKTANNIWNVMGIEIELGNPKPNPQPKLILSPSTPEIKEEVKPVMAIMPAVQKLPHPAIIIEEKKELMIEVDSQTPPSASPMPSPKHKGDEVSPLEMYRQIQDLLVPTSNGYLIPVMEPSPSTLVPYIKGQIANLAKTQIGSRFLQEQIKERGNEFIT